MEAVAATDDDDDDELTLTVTPPSSEHRLDVTLEANRKHIVSFRTTIHGDGDDVTSGDLVVIGFGSNMVSFHRSASITVPHSEYIG